MADDVKVKFGGDFTDVPKGAEAAVNSAGTVFKNWIGEYAKGLKNKLASAFSLDNIVSKFVEGIGEQFQKFKEIDNMARKLGVTRVELQQFSKLGKEFNIDMETMGRSIAFANKTLGAAAEGNKQAQEKLLRYGFTQKEVMSGSIKSTDVLYKLAEAYERNKKIYGETAASNILAKDTTDSFGRAGADLVTILKEGNEAIKERIRLMNVYTESEVKTGARTARQVEKAEATFKKYTYGSLTSFFGRHMEKFEIFGDLKDIMKEQGLDYAGALNKPGSSIKIAELLTKAGEKRGMDAADLANLISDRYNKPGRRLIASDEEKAFIGFLVNNLNEIQAEKDKEKKPITEEYTPGAKALVASSLQEIGGGDIRSVMAGLGPNDIAENTRRTAVATEHIAAQGPQQSPAKLR